MLKGEEINKQVENIYSFTKDKYGENNILGVFVVGNANYNLAEDISELSYLLLTLPTLEQLCFEETNMFFEDILGNTIEVVDLPLLYTYSLKQNQLVMQILITEYFKINPLYKEYFLNEIKPLGDELFVLDKKTGLATAIEDLQYSLTDNNNLEAARLDLTIDNYINGVPLEQCVRIKNTVLLNYLMDIKHQKQEIDIESLMLRITRYKNYVQDLPSMDNNLRYEECKKLLKQKIVTLIGRAIQNDKNNTDTFLNMFTSREKEALKAIIEHLDDGKGNISLKKIIDECNISRPVFMNVINKIKNAGAAEVINQGAKGTYFNILNPKLFNIEI